MEQKTISVKELAAVLGVGYNRAYELVHRSDFPALQVGRRWLISNPGLDRWIEKNIERKEDD